MQLHREELILSRALNKVLQHAPPRVQERFKFLQALPKSLKLRPHQALSSQRAKYEDPNSMISQQNYQ